MRWLPLSLAVYIQFTALLGHAQTTQSPAKESAVSVEFLATSTKWLKSASSVIAPIKRLQKLEGETLSSLSGSNDHLALAPVINEVKAHRKALAASLEGLSIEDQKRELQKLEHNQRVITEFRTALTEIQKDLKPAVQLPVPRLTSAPNLLESWHIIELPALQRELSSLQTAIKTRQLLLGLQLKAAGPEDKDIPYFDSTGALAKVDSRFQALKSERVESSEQASKIAGPLEIEISTLDAELKDEAELLKFVHARANEIRDERTRANVRSFEAELRSYLGKKALLRLALAGKRLQVERLLGKASPVVEPKLPPVYIPPKPAGVHELTDVAAYVMENRNAREQTSALLMRDYTSKLTRVREQDEQSWAQAEAYVREFRQLHAGRVHELQTLLSENHRGLEQLLKSAEARAEHRSQASRKESQERLSTNRAAFLKYAQRESEAWHTAQQSAFREAESRGWLKANPLHEQTKEKESSAIKQPGSPTAKQDETPKTAASPSSISTPASESESKPKASHSDVNIMMQLFAPSPRGSQTPKSDKPEAVVPILNLRF